MRSTPVISIVALVATLAAASPGRAGGPALPVPPHQAEPWTPPKTTLPRFVVEATAALCDQGLADPRGCAYRTIEIEVGGPDDEPSRALPTAGWAMPAAEGEPRHAIAWNGLVYPLLRLGGPADLDADVRTFRVVLGKPRFDGFRGHPRVVAVDESATASETNFHPIKVCLLLRLGRADLAEPAWAAGGLPAPPEPGSARSRVDLRSYGVSYVSLAQDLAWSHFDRAVSAHARGDDAIALADLRFVDRFQAVSEVKAEAIGFVRPESEDFPPRSIPRPTYLDGLDGLPALLADQERRARERAGLPVPPEPVETVASLIRDLDEVEATRPGELHDDPIVRRLVARGEAAIGPLIEVVRSDDRLTRVVTPSQGPTRGRTARGVDWVASAALATILRRPDLMPSSFGPTSVAQDRARRRALAETFEAHGRAPQSGLPPR